MAIQFIVLGKTKERYFQESEQEYLKRLTRFVKLNYLSLSASKKEQNRELCLKQEEQSLLKQIKSSDYVILLDEGGKNYDSRAFAEQLNNWMSHNQNICFVVGGAFGFSEKIKERANSKLSLSKLTFPHHMVRSIFLEQLYRAFTILNGGKYHND
ncbi:MAG: 23S rRNA (pseudouridine(1915)-N(3))-methyltransferase RlmH [Bacteroidia bacterium]